MLMLPLIGFVVLIHVFVNVFFPSSSDGSFSHSRLGSSSSSTTTTTFYDSSVCAVSAISGYVVPSVFEFPVCAADRVINCGRFGFDGMKTNEVSEIFVTPSLFDKVFEDCELEDTPGSVKVIEPDVPSLSDHGQSKGLTVFDSTGNSPVKIYYSKVFIYGLVIYSFIVIVKWNEAARTKALITLYEPNEADRVFHDELIGSEDEKYGVSESSGNENEDSDFEIEDFAEIADFIDEKDANDSMDPIIDDGHWIEIIKEMYQTKGKKYENSGHSSDITKGLYLTIKNDQELVVKKVHEYRNIVSDCLEHFKCFQDAVVVGHERVAGMTVEVLEERENRVIQRKNYLIEIFRTRSAGNDADVSDNEDFDCKSHGVESSGNNHMKKSIAFNEPSVDYGVCSLKYAYHDVKYDEDDYDADRSLTDESSDSDSDDYSDSDDDFSPAIVEETPLTNISPFDSDLC